MPATTNKTRFGRFAWGVLAYNLGVVLWGAYVRATGSGAGCGDHWPLCNGEVLPRAARIETLIEFTHRVTSGLALLTVFGLLLWSFRLYPRGHRVRKAVSYAAVFLVLEALLGAGLVLLRYVEQNASAGRAVYLSAHLVNTQILLGTLALTAWFATTAERPLWGRRPGMLVAALPVVLAVSVTGAIAALGDTLYPAESLAAGMRAEFSAASGVLLRLRLLHPAAAILASAYLLYAARRAMRHDARLKAGAYIVTGLAGLQVAAGAVNVALLAPVWMQLTHLLLANLMWLAVVLLVLESPRREVRVAAPA